MTLIRVPFELNNGNDGRGSKWFSSAKLRTEFEAKLRALGLIFDEPLVCGRADLTITRILGTGQRLWDADSIGRGSAKELIDACKSCGWWVDDGPKYIRHVDYRQDETQREHGPAVLIEITEVSLEGPLRQTDRATKAVRFWH